MLKPISPLPFPFWLVNQAESVIRFALPRLGDLEEETVHRAAMTKTGLHDFGNPDYLEGLRRLLISAKTDANLHFVGRIGMHRAIVGSLANRLRLVNKRKQEPGIFEKPLQPPLIVMGMPRSGTTFLHRLLTLDPACRGVPLWEMSRPIGDRPGDEDQRRREIKKEINLRHRINRDLDRKHYIRFDTPEECFWALGLTFVSRMYWIMAPVFSYTDWYFEQPRDRKYQEYRWILQVLQAAAPEHRLALKAPAHTGALAELIRHVPEALIVQTHRDMVSVVNSLNSTFYTTHSMMAKAIDVPRMVDSNIRFLENELQRNVAARRQYADRVCDVQYQQLVADPIGTVRGIYAHYDLPWPETYTSILKEYIENNPKGKHGSHRYRSEDFGYTDGAILERFAEYDLEK